MAHHCPGRLTVLPRLYLVTSSPWSPLPQVLESRGTWRAAGHLAGGLWLLGNILFHYLRCVRTSPGFTANISVQVRTVCAGRSLRAELRHATIVIFSRLQASICHVSHEIAQ